MPTIQAVIDNILTSIPNAPFAETVDVIKTGDPAQEVTGIVTTFLATQAVLQRGRPRRELRHHSRADLLQSSG
jgi:hypothetical protein